MDGAPRDCLLAQLIEKMLFFLQLAERQLTQSQAVSGVNSPASRGSRVKAEIGTSRNDVSALGPVFMNHTSEKG
jgi:hypothetical protein